MARRQSDSTGARVLREQYNARFHSHAYMQSGRAPEFVPSQFSYGNPYGAYGQVSYGQNEVEARPEKSPGTTVSTTLSTDTTAQAIGIGAQVFDALFGGDPRAEPDVIKAKIENKQRMYDSLPSFLQGTVGQIYLNDINKLKAQLSTAREVAREKDRSAVYWEVAKVGGVIAVGVGVIILAGMAVNQFKRAKLTQAEIERLRAQKEGG